MASIFVLESDAPIMVELFFLGDKDSARSLIFFAFSTLSWYIFMLSVSTSSSLVLSSAMYYFLCISYSLSFSIVVSFSCSVAVILFCLSLNNTFSKLMILFLYPSMIFYTIVPNYSVSVFNKYATLSRQ